MLAPHWKPFRKDAACQKKVAIWTQGLSLTWAVTQGDQVFIVSYKNQFPFFLIITFREACGLQ